MGGSESGEVSFGERVLRFWGAATPPVVSDREIDVLDPIGSPEVRRVLTVYYRRYFNRPGSRIFMFGINPGRFGAGITGVPFTDPVALSELFGIEHTFEMRRELSSVFIYDFIERFGGLTRFADHFYVTAVCPYGFVRAGKNINYYDRPALLRDLTPYIEANLRDQIAIGARSDVAIVIGAGKNAAFFQRINRVHRWFDEVLVLEHPRFILQYRRRQMESYLSKYVDTCERLLV